MSCSNPDLFNSPETLNQIVTWLRQSGRLALGYFNHVSPQAKTDASYVTQADLEIQDFLASRIRAAYPQDNLIGEEETGTCLERDPASTWVIDPIDGTTVFVQGLPGWGIAIGLLYHGQPCFGAFYMPLLDDMTYTAAQGQLFCNDRLMVQTVCRNWGAKGFLSVSASAHRDFEIKVQRTRAVGSIGASLVYTARGIAAGAFIPRARLWDLVAGAAILTRAGGELRYISGCAIDYRELLDGRLTPEPVIAAHPDLQLELRSAIGPRSTP